MMAAGRVFLFVVVMAFDIRGSSSASSSSSTSGSSSSSSSSSSAAAGGAAGSAEVIDASGCPVTWTLVGEKCITAVTSPLVWQDALDTCADKGGALFFPESAESMNYVRGLITSNCSGFWLGCIDRSPADGQYECPSQDGVYWNNSTDFLGYWNWSNGNPAPSLRGSDDYCILTFGASYWIEGPCTYSGVCPVCARNRQVLTTLAPSPTTGITVPNAPQSRQRSAVYKSLDPKLGCLANSYVLMSFTAPTRIRCAALCLAHVECRSFHFFRWKRNNCQLNSEIIGSVPPDGVNYNTTCTYFE